MKELVAVFASLLVLLALTSGARPADALDRDEDGWTILRPSPDTRKVYVSSSEGDDANDGLSPRTAVRTLRRAKGLMRGGHPDWMLLKRGDVWRESIRLPATPGGRSESERMVYAYYGDEGPRPLLLSGISFGLIKDHSNYAVVGLDFYADRRDPSSPTFEGADAPGVGIRIVGANRNILVEDCAIRFGQHGIVCQGPCDLAVRRCMIWNSYRGTGNNPMADRASNVFTIRLRNLLIEECFLDHGGWNPSVGGGRSIYSHNLYLSRDTRHQVVRGNIIARGASHGMQARSGGLVQNNLFIRNALAMFTSGNPAEGECPRAHVLNNVVLESDDIAPTKWADSGNMPRGTGIHLFCRPDTVCRGNICLDKLGHLRKARALVGGGPPDGFDPATLEKPCLIQSNIAANWPSNRGPAIGVGDEVEQYFRLENNVVDGKLLDTGEPVEFVNPDRRLDSYLRSIGQQGDTLEFLALARKAWLAGPRAFPAEYRAATVNDYIRAGFRRK